MSTGKFASITASLLARKGDAQPSTLDIRPTRAFAWSSQSNSETPSRVPPMDERAVERGTFVRFRPEIEAVSEIQDLRLESVEAVGKAVAKPAREHPREPARTDKPRRMFVVLSPNEYERLGIVAVKRDTSRHQLLREALDTFMDWAVEEYRTDCACVSGDGCKGSCD
jgi:hypothetical protein